MTTSFILSKFSRFFILIVSILLSYYGVSGLSGCESFKTEPDPEETKVSLMEFKIYLTGDKIINLSVGETFIDPGARAYERFIEQYENGDIVNEVTKEITSSIIKSGSVDTSTIGTYTIIYSITDNEGNTSQTTRTVIVSADPNDEVNFPVITFIGEAYLEFSLSQIEENNITPDSISEGYATATDYEDGDLTSQILYSNNVDLTKPGIYQVIFSVEDSDANTVSSILNIILTDDIPPTILLTSSSTINLTAGDTFTDPGATASDNVDGDITPLITTSGSVDTSIAGTYEITYNVTDAAGNSATPTTREVIVNAVVAAIIYFENETCKCPNAIVGDSEIINGIVYTAVDNTTIAGQIANGNINLCTTLVTDMSGERDNNTSGTNFFNDNSFNSNINFWDTFNVTSMERMFVGGIFNQNISSWDTSNVTNMGSMFRDNLVFNQNISSWDMSSVTDLHRMFQGASSFNQNLSNWNTSSITDLFSMFQDATSFNRDLSSWNTSNIIYMDYLFSGAVKFNQNIGNWNTSSATSMYGMFYNATDFNQNLSGWCVSNITEEPSDGRPSSDFATGSALTQANKPIWGTCPD